MSRFALLVFATLACGRAAANQTRAVAPWPDPLVPAEPIFQGGLAKGWADYGWAPRQLGPGAARIDFASYAGWIVAHPGEPLQAASFAGLTYRYRGPQGLPDFMELRLESTRGESFPRILIDASRRKVLAGGWTQVYVAMRELDPQRAPFDQVVLRARRNVPDARLEIDGLTLVKGEYGPETPQHPAVSAAVLVDCKSPGRAINPMIYGIAYTFHAVERDRWIWELNPGARRWGGNPTSRYNWEIGNAWNTAVDWFFRNVNYTDKPGPAWQAFLDEDREHRLRSALTVPMLGWVAKDATSYSFPVSEFGPQQATAPELPDAGNGVSPSGVKLKPGPPERTSVAAPPGFVERWVRAIGARNPHGVDLYFLDNEPTLWDSTHRDVHPEPVGYDEFLDKTIAYASAVRRASPHATIAGGTVWGWPALFYSGIDMNSSIRIDRVRHGGTALLPWWLAKVRAYEKTSGEHLLDVVDVHFYPQGKDLGISMKGATDSVTAARRIRSVRALWDPAYADESWIAEPVRLVPRLREWIDSQSPGLGISIGEWNFGAEAHMSGGLAVAEALGRFGTTGVDAAFYWDYPARHSAAYWAFRAFRNYDGHDATFLDWSVPVRISNGMSSAFASRDRLAGKMVLVLLATDPQTPLATRIQLSGCGPFSGGRLFTYSGSPSGFEETRLGATPDTLQLPPYSISVLELQPAH